MPRIYSVHGLEPMFPFSRSNDRSFVANTAGCEMVYTETVVSRPSTKKSIHRINNRMTIYQVLLSDEMKCIANKLTTSTKR